MKPLHPPPPRVEPEIIPLLHEARMAVAPLGQREREVLAALAAGQTTKEIADRLGIAFATARTHIERIFVKLGVNCRAGAAAQWSLAWTIDSAAQRVARFPDGRVKSR